MSNAEAIRTAAQAVLDRWDSPQWEWSTQGPTADLMHALRAALAQPAASGEPVAVITHEGTLWLNTNPHRLPIGTRLYTTQPAPALSQNEQWNCAGREPYKFHPQASHVNPDYRDGWNAALDAVARSAQPAPARVPLTEAQMLDCVRSVGVPVPMGLVRVHGPYEVDEPTWLLIQLVRAIERAHGITKAKEAP